MTDAISRSDVFDMINRTKEAAMSDGVEFTASQRNAIKAIANLFSDVVKDIPALDVQPVVHARWVPSSKLELYHIYTNCGLEHPLVDMDYFSVAHVYCPAC